MGKVAYPAIVGYLLTYGSGEFFKMAMHDELEFQNKK
jgi:hypothetical protein